MNRMIALAAVTIITATLSACANGPHTKDSMLSGSHVMPGSKAGTMSDRAMPSRSANCTESALASMPADHRQACEKPQGDAGN